MIKYFSFSCLIAFTSILLSGCYPGGADFTEDYDVVYTNHRASYDFQSQATYALPDKIVVDVEIDRGGHHLHLHEGCLCSTHSSTH
jgi:hypothetical protein